MGKHKKFKARDKSIQRMTRDGLVQENRTTGETVHISQRNKKSQFHHASSVSENFSKNHSEESGIPPRKSISSHKNTTHLQTVFQDTPKLTPDSSYVSPIAYDKEVAPSFSDNRYVSNSSTEPNQDTENNYIEETFSTNEVHDSHHSYSPSENRHRHETYFPSQGPSPPKESKPHSYPYRHAEHTSFRPHTPSADITTEATQSAFHTPEPSVPKDIKATDSHFQLNENTEKETLMHTPEAHTASEIVHSAFTERSEPPLHSHKVNTPVIENGISLHHRQEKVASPSEKHWNPADKRPKEHNFSKPTSEPKLHFLPETVHVPSHSVIPERYAKFAERRFRNTISDNGVSLNHRQEKVTVSSETPRNLSAKHSTEKNISLSSVATDKQVTQREETAKAPVHPVTKNSLQTKHTSSKVSITPVLSEDNSAHYHTDHSSISERYMKLAEKRLDRNTVSPNSSTSSQKATSSKKAVLPNTVAQPLLSEKIVTDNGVILNHRQEKVAVTSEKYLKLMNHRLKKEQPALSKTAPNEESTSAPAKKMVKKSVYSNSHLKTENNRSSYSGEKAEPVSSKPEIVSRNSKNKKQATSIHNKGKRSTSTETKKKKSRLQFDTEETSPPSGIKGTLKKGGKKATQVAVSATSSAIRAKFHESEDDNVALESVNRSGLFAEHSVRRAAQSIKNRREKKRNATNYSRFQEKPETNGSRLKSGTPPRKKQDEQKKGMLHKFYQKMQIKKRASESAKAAKKGKKKAEKTVGTAMTFTEKGISVIKEFFATHKRTGWTILSIILIIIMLLSQLQSCSTMAAGSLSAVTASSWPADDSEITAADLYYTQLEANLQYEIDHTESTHSGYDEYNYNLDEIGHDPVALISYLCAKYGTFTLHQVKRELDTLFSLQYRLDIQTFTEQRTVTRSVSVGESLGTVVTSGYCNCQICCGQWSGGPTASGVYPTSNHTLAVDASNPTVPMGTEIIMNGTLYKVEDTGAFDQYGVDFDVYFDNHSTALQWGHRSFEAYYAGGNGSSTIDVTTTEDVKVCNVSLSTQSLPNLFTSRLTSEQLDLYTVYQSTRGNRQFLGTPLNCNWYGNVSSYYGYRISPTSGNLEIHRGLDIAVPQGTEILATHDGTVTTAAHNNSYGNYIVLEDDKGYKTKYAHCSSLNVSTGQTVTKGDVIAKVGSTGNSTGPHLHIEFLYNGEYFNPYFYLGVGQGSIYGNGFGFTGDVDALDDATFAALIHEAEKYLGMAYVWGGSSPSTGFDCSGFVSYVFTHSGVYNMGRLTAQGIYDISSPVNPADAKPGDIIFFQGTYNTSGVSHVGIYVGNGQMIHCGDPIKYTSINTPYWQSHFYAFGRVN